MTTKRYGHGRVFQQSLRDCIVLSLRHVFVACGLPSQFQSSTYDVFCYEAHCRVPWHVFLSTEDEAIEYNLYIIYW